MASTDLRGESPQRRIVVADDDPDQLELVADLLREEGYDVVEVSDGSQLLVRVEDAFVGLHSSEPADLFITDNHMPGLTGMEVLQGLREAGLKTPVIVMTSLGVEEARELSRAFDASFLQKPFTREQLLAGVRAALG